MSDWLVPDYILKPSPAALPLVAVVEETKGLVFVAKSVQSLEFEVLITKVFLGIEVAMRGVYR